MAIIQSEKTEHHILLSCTSDVKTLRRIEKHYHDKHAHAHNAPVNYIVKSYLAEYFFQRDYGENTYEPPALKNWMDLIYDLSLNFHSLEELINRPLQDLSTLKNSLSSWHTDFEEILAKFQCEKSPDERTCYLIAQLKIHVKKLTENFNSELFSKENAAPQTISNLYAAHNMQFGVTSLGRLVSDLTHEVLKTGLAGADYLSNRPILNLFHVHPAIAALSDAKHQLFEKSFTMQGSSHVSPYHPSHQSILKRLHIQDETKAQYQLPLHDAKTAEKWVAILSHKRLASFNVSPSFWLSVLQFLSIPFEAALFALHLALDMLALVLALACKIVFIDTDSILKVLSTIDLKLIQIHQHLSLFSLIQSYKNKLQVKGWKSKIDDLKLINLLTQSQNTQNWFVDFSEKTSASRVFSALKKTLVKSDPVMNYASFSKILMYFKPQKPQYESILSSVEYTPKNEINTAIDIVEELVSALDNIAILSFFRKYPLIATANFMLSCATLASFQSPLYSNQFLLFMQTIMAKLSKAYFGKESIEGFSNAMFSCFLFWQLNLAAADMGLQLLERGQIDWLNYIIQHPDQLVIGTSAIVGLGMGLAYLPTLPTEINLPFNLKLPNLLSLMINSIIAEARPCLEGILPFNQISLSFMGLKTSLFFLNFFSSGPSEEVQAKFIALVLQNDNILQSLQSLFPYLLPPAEEVASGQRTITTEQTQRLIQDLNNISPQELFHNFQPECSEETYANIPLYKLLVLLENKHPMVMEALKHKDFANQYLKDLYQAFKDYNNSHPENLLDPKVILPAFYNQYCQTRLINILRVLTICLLPLHLLQWAYGYIFNNVAHEFSGRKKSAEDIFILLKLLLTITHPLLQASIIIWNYVVLGTLRSPSFIIRVLTEGTLKLFSESMVLKNTLFYTLIADDVLKSLKLHYLLAYFIKPLQILYANIAYYSGRYGDLSGPCGALTTRIIEIEQEKTQVSTTLGLS